MDTLLPPSASSEALHLLQKAWREALESHPFTAHLRSLVQAQKPAETEGRILSREERDQLERQGNSCEDWGRVRLSRAVDSRPGIAGPGGSETLQRIRGCHFSGDVVLAPFHGEARLGDGTILPHGLYQSQVQDCRIGNACIRQVGLLSRAVVEEGACLLAVGAVTGKISPFAPPEGAAPDPALADKTGAGTKGQAEGPPYGLGSRFSVGSETGLRSEWILPGLDLERAVLAASLLPADQEAFAAFLRERLAEFPLLPLVVGKGSAIVSTATVSNSYIGEGGRITGARAVEDSLLLSSLSRPCRVGEGGLLRRSLLLEGAAVESGAMVFESALLEASSAAVGGTVTQAVLGPNTHVEKGEITSSLVGPFVGMHHQSLLIAALWPEGRGNIGYGANVGSNHTGKKPDQEIRPGEGNFFGLGVSVKFPANFEEAPFSLFATGITSLPQKIAFPFSLVNAPSASPSAPFPAGFNEIKPGWMWTENPYALFRNAYKYAERNKARGHAFPSGLFDSTLFAPRLAVLVLKACARLEARAGHGDRPPGSSGEAPSVFFGDRDLPGLGKNVMTDASRKAALDAYRDYLAFYLLFSGHRPALSGKPAPSSALPALSSASGPSSPTATGGVLLPAAADRLVFDFLQGRSNPPADLFEKGAAEASLQPLSVSDRREFLQREEGRFTALRRRILESLAREDRRGRQIFPDYEAFHGKAAEDPLLGKLEKDFAIMGIRLDPAGPGSARPASVLNEAQPDPPRP